MKLFTAKLIRRSASAAGLLAGLALSASASFGQSAPFAGFAGNWSGKGTVTLSDGSKENIRCKASYRVDRTGMTMNQNLHCASDSYRFDLSSNVVSHGSEITGQWSEASRNLSGSLPRPRGRRRDRSVRASRRLCRKPDDTRPGKRQSVWITSKGEIRNVSITMVRS